GAKGRPGWNPRTTSQQVRPRRRRPRRAIESRMMPVRFTPRLRTFSNKLTFSVNAFGGFAGCSRNDGIGLGRANGPPFSSDTMKPPADKLLWKRKVNSYFKDSLHSTKNAYASRAIWN